MALELARPSCPRGCIVVRACSMTANSWSVKRREGTTVKLWSSLVDIATFSLPLHHKRIEHKTMAEEIQISAGSKEEKYKELLPQVRAVVETETDPIANMANVASMLHETFGFWWTGFYRVLDGELVLGPFQGPLACTRIKKGKGVCGTAWERAATVIVPDVEAFPGHIACSSLSRSEIVVPVQRDGEVIAVLDIDSKDLATFDEVDKKYLEEVVKVL